LRSRAVEQCKPNESKPNQKNKKPSQKREKYTGKSSTGTNSWLTPLSSAGQLNPPES